MFAYALGHVLSGHDTDACLLAYGSAAFKWKLHCHWPIGTYQHYVTSFS